MKSSFSLFLLAAMVLSACKTSDSAGLESSVKADQGSGGTFGDGCYGFVKPGIDGGAICVSGTAEEGIGGAGAMVAFLTTTGEPYRCFTTTKIEVSGTETKLTVTGENSTAKMTFNGGKQGLLDLGGAEPWTYAFVPNRPDLMEKARAKCSGDSPGDGAPNSNASQCFLPGSPGLAGCGTIVDCPVANAAETPSFCLDESLAWANQTQCRTRAQLEDMGCGTIAKCKMCADE